MAMQNAKKVSLNSDEKGALRVVDLVYFFLLLLPPSKSATALPTEPTESIALKRQRVTSYK